MPSPLPLTFTARVTKGAGRGRLLGFPTLNLRLSDVPQVLPEGIFACRARWARRSAAAALHYGPRPVFKAGGACELHIIDRILVRSPRSVTVDVLTRLRSVRNFPSVAALKRQIARDITRARSIEHELCKNGKQETNKRVNEITK